ncbi:Nuclear pore complex protein Nup160 OS=Mus musculus GN=Nup160 PE=1 SV=2 [Rhizoctonia solani AG-1 IB]|uniref:Nuclear pore complex protein Nup160 n=1 Tax=Thanatephorus cucumeris (strain AG1-IB / isolate 7/3/14) TaxID=1108050 RepID=A0A0B7FP84_THACB|nr:Nuclear pore complex protein Nup160 OS=Mus musculus GN=Nup160 PE=1 SV=2 [Rhizoctonia solani AG-1 IB]
MSSVLYTHISGLSTNVVPVEIPSQEQHEGREELDGFVEHAEYATTIHAHDAGTVLLRVLDGGHMLELMALESGMRTARFSFTSKIALQPALMMLGIAELHVLVVTVDGSIFRLRFILPHLWTSTQYTPKEYRITSITAPIDGIVHVPEVGVVFIGLNDGGVLRLTAKMNGLEYTGDWSEESLHGPPNYFPSFSSLMPSFYSGPTAPDPSKIIALASIPPPLADSGYARATSLVVTLSRDRHLRVWLTGNGRFVASKQIPSQFFQTDALIARSATPGKTPALEGHIIDSDYRPIIRVLPPVLDEDDFSPDMDAGTEVVVFMPTPSAETAGFFLLYRLSAQDRASSRRDLNFVGRKSCSAQTEGWELRDFLVADDVLYLLWNSQGRTVIQTSTYDLDEAEAEQEPWNTLSADGEKELSPDSFEESAQEGDTLASSILAAILRPGAFSPYTLHVAIKQYEQSLVDVAPYILNTPYPTLAERIAAVVGSSVSLTTDPRTGAQMWDRYWSALRRDWEGFVARCQAVERAGRWPLGLSRARDGSVIVLARERMGAVVTLDEPMSVHSLAGANTSSGASLFGVAWSLRANIPVSELRQLEDALRSVSGDGRIAYSHDSVLRDVAQRHLDGLLPEGPAAFVRSGLGMLGDLEDAVLQALDVVGRLDHVVKLEDPDGGMGLAIGHDGEFKKALTTAYVAQSIESRYDLCLSILLLLLFIALDSPDTLKSSIAAARACVAFHALGLLRSLTKQSAGDLAGVSGGYGDVEDDVLARFEAMGFASPAPGAIGVGRSGPQYSLVHSLLPRANLSASVLQSAHAFIREAGVLSDTALLDAGPGTVGLVERLRSLGYLDFSRELAMRLPPTPGVCYVHARLLMDLGRPDEAAVLFEKVANNFGPITHLTPNDQAALETVLPPPLNLESTCTYYRHVAELFNDACCLTQAIPFWRQAIEDAPPDLDARGMWSKVFRAYVDLAMWEDAYVVLVSTPYTDLHRENVRQLVIAMCEANHTDKLAHLGFVGHHVEVERTLSFKARHADPFAWPDYAKILYAWHVFRGDFRSAGAAMYERARRLGEEAVVEEEFVQVANVQARCYLAAINSLELVDPSHSWVLLSASGDEDSGRKRRKLTVHIPEAKFNPDCKDFEVVQLSDMRQEHALVSARIELLGYYPELNYHSLSSSQDIVSLYVRANNFDLAFSTGRLVGGDLGTAFVNLTAQCMNLTASAELADNESIPWLETDQTLAWDGSTVQRAWHYLQLSLERHDVEEGDWSYRKIVADAVLELDQSARLPNWLVSFFLEKQPDYLVRLCLKYSRLQDALLYSIRMVKEATDVLSVMPPRHASTTCLPYSLFDQLIIATTEPTSSPEQKQLAETLKKDLATRLSKLQKWSAPR